jgi:hypothetical protein
MRFVDRANSGTGFHFTQKTWYLKWGGGGGDLVSKQMVYSLLPTRQITNCWYMSIVTPSNVSSIQNKGRTTDRPGMLNLLVVFFHRSKPPHHDAALSRMSEVSFHHRAGWFPRTLHLRPLCSVPFRVKSAWSRTATVIHVLRLVACSTVYAWRISICAQFFWHLQFLLSIRLWNPRVKSDIYRILELSLLVTQYETTHRSITLFVYGYSTMSNYMTLNGGTDTG